jgi:hypothetical protein
MFQEERRAGSLMLNSYYISAGEKALRRDHISYSIFDITYQELRDEWLCDMEYGI